MGPIAWFLFVYVLGGVTFFPLLLCLILYHAHKTFPSRPDSSLPPADDPAELARANDDKVSLKTATDTLAEQFHRKHESDVAAGYFAVCREYVPAGINGKPPERTTPAGEVVATESPSVYQSMYRSIFDRQQKPTIEPNKSNGRNVKKANNVFFVVLRHGHLMLYDDVEQLEVRYVISLEHHDVSVYNGTAEVIPEKELWVKRNAIRLTRRPISDGIGALSLPFYLFSENMSEKEDFYFALLKNLEKNPGPGEAPPSPQHFDVKNIVALVQKLHSSEEHLQTRWLNGLMGRLFLAMYKRPEMEAFVRTRLTNKISRVKKPNFITKLALQRIVTGESAPYITNPRLKDLTVNGDCMVEADIQYNGKFRIEIAATARIDLGKRFGAKEVELVLAVLCNKIEGHVLIKIKPPPSNRLWFTFETMPKIDMTIEPIVSSRQITYSIILRAIESRIREVIAESLVLPFWDDIAFMDTSDELFRGGIWQKATVVPKPENIPDEDAEDEAEADGDRLETLADTLKAKDIRTMSMPVQPSSDNVIKPRGGKRESVHPLAEMGTAVSSGLDRTTRAEPPRMMRSTSFAAAADPMVTVNHADGDYTKDSALPGKSDEASAILRDLSSKSAAASPSESLQGSPPNELATTASSISGSPHVSPNISRESLGAGHARQKSDGSSARSAVQSSYPASPASGTFGSKAPSVNEDAKSTKSFGSAARSLTAADRKQALASVNAAAVAAQKWGWGVINRNKQKEAEASNREKTLNTPMGRGRPLPPPGTPLPPPERSLASSVPFALPKRKPVPPPLLPKRSEVSNDLHSTVSVQSPPKPPLPERRKRQSSFQGHDEHEDEVLVVEAPLESPISPVPLEHQDDFFGHGEEAESSMGAWESSIPDEEPEASGSVTSEANEKETPVREH